MISKRFSKFTKSLKIKKLRVREKRFLVEGKKNVIELVHSTFKIHHIFATSEFIEGNKFQLQNVNHLLQETTSSELQDIGTFKTNNDCLAVAEIKDYSLSDLSFEDHIVALDKVSDPGNLGTIIRTLDWFGFDQLVCSHETAEFYNPKVINSTMGSFTRIKIVYTDLVDFIRQAPLQAFGADLEGTIISQWNPQKPVIVVMGSESHGISPELEKSLDGKVTIPKYGQAESLNVGIATAIFCNQLRS